ncbi:ATP-binding cassette domain-containing protein [Streptomyces sp. NPDC013953]|uniref:ATP-binding cassette domain-containing protein n=1 Tax=Streptomyces sp. NPDC013953 TaxID=3364868 RepID=UPI0037026351
MDKGIPGNPDRTDRTDRADRTDLTKGGGGSEGSSGTKGADATDRTAEDGTEEAQPAEAGSGAGSGAGRAESTGRTGTDTAQAGSAAPEGRPTGTEDGARDTRDSAADAEKPDRGAEDRAGDRTEAAATDPDTATTASGTGTDADTTAGTATDTATTASGTATGADTGRTGTGRPAGAPSAEEPRGAALVAEGFGMKGPRGWVFRGVSVEAAPGDLITLEGPSGSGRTCLLLALTGRMRPTEGHAEVAGLRLPRKMAAVRRISALGPVPGVSDLDPAFTVGEHLRERALLQRRFDASPLALLRPRAERAAASRARIEAALEATGLDVAALPKGERTSVRDLERLEALRLSVALALIGEPRLLAVDDADLKLSDADRTEAWRMLRSIADGGTTVLAVCSEAPGNTITIRTTEEGTADALAETGRA